MRQLKITQQITKRDSETFTKYLNEVSSIPMLTPDEELELAQKIKKGDKNALEKLVKSNLRFVISVAKQYSNQGLTLQDLINEGNIGLIKAAERFDETRGFKFISYAVWWIRQSIMQAICENGRQIRMPLNKISAITKINQAKSELEQILQREATSDEISDFLMDIEGDKETGGDPGKFTSLKIEELLKSSNKVTHLDAPISNESDAGNMLELIIGENEEDVNSNLKKMDLQIELQRVIKNLKPRERDVLIYYYGLFNNKALSLDEIARNFGLTRERVRQIKESAIRRLRFKSRKTKLIEYR